MARVSRHQALTGVRDVLSVRVRRQDGSGALNKEEIQRLVSKTGNKLQLQDPPFDMDHDWGSMYKTASGEVVSGLAAAPTPERATLLQLQPHNIQLVW